MAPAREIYAKHVPRDFINRGDPSSGHLHALRATIPPTGNLESIRIRAAVAVPTVHSTLYLAIGVGVGGLLAIAIAVIATQLVRKRQAHKREISALTETQATRSTGQESYDIGTNRPFSTSRWSTLVTWHNKAGWTSFPAEDSVQDPHHLDNMIAEPRRVKSTLKRPKYRGLPLKKLRHLSAITESPRSKSVKSPSFGEPDAVATPEPLPQSHPSLKLVSEDEGIDIFTCPTSPRPDVMPSYAIKSPGRYGAAIANHERMKPLRSISVGGIRSESTTFGDAIRYIRPQMHSRSISLGTPRTQAPSRPVPPIPLRAAGGMAGGDVNRQGLLVRKTSCSSQESANSSVLVTTPILQVRSQNKGESSPSVEHVVAEDDFAELKNVTHRRWRNPLISGPRSRENGDEESGIDYYKNESIHSNLAHFSTDVGRARRKSSSSSISSNDSRRTHLAVPQVATANRVSVSRVSSTNSINSVTGVKTVLTPRKASRSASVSAFGSPAQRKKLSVLRNISSNTIPLSREASVGSTSSSNGNPFKWDMPVQKPSALKGSPNAKKGHKRQNCVRISVLAPQILGPPPSRSATPSVMYGIEEEDTESEVVPNPSKRPFLPSQRTSRPPSAMSLSGNLRVQTLRASLTPSSPTLSQWNACHRDSGLPSQPSGSLLSVSPRVRIPSRLSDQSSLYSIPTFPSPSKTTISAVHRENPVPEFCLSRPSTDGAEVDSSSSFGLQLALDSDMPSSPPVLTRIDVDYDPDWRMSMATIPVPHESHEYDPASPGNPTTWDSTSPGHTSPLFHLAQTGPQGRLREQGSPHSRPNSYGGELPVTPPESPPQSPPQSPDIMPEKFLDFFENKGSDSEPARSSQSLTSANAGCKKHKVAIVDFPGAPVLPPPSPSPPFVPPRSAARLQATTNIAHLQPMRSAPSPPKFSDPIDIPSPLHIKSAPLGPRGEPPKSVLKCAMALRRMDSEMDNTWRDSRCYVRLGREASAKLPLAIDESRIDLFGFGFEVNATFGAKQHDVNPIDRIEMDDLDCRINGALAGFGATSTSRSPSVWEDGEDFWQAKQRSMGVAGLTSMPSTSIPIHPVAAMEEGKGDAPVTPVAQLQMRKLNPTGTSPRRIDASKLSAQTPKSLYDADGFLRSSPVALR